MFRLGQLAVHGLAILLGRNEAGISNRGKNFLHLAVLGPKLMFAECDKHYPSRSGQTTLATAIINFTKPVTKINSGLVDI